MSWETYLKILFSILVFLLVSWCYVAIRSYYSKIDLNNTIELKKTKRYAIIQLRKKYPKIAKSVVLQSKLNELKDIRELHVDLKQQISSPRFSNEEGFSKYFLALSRHAKDDLWLTEIKIQKGGTYIVLKGLTNNVSKVQSLIKKLEVDEVFSNKTIKLKKIETSTLSSGNDEFSLEIFSRVAENDKETNIDNLQDKNVEQ